MSKPCILVADAISPLGIEKLQQDPVVDVEVRTDISADELLADAAKYAAIIVRSRTQVTGGVIAKAANLKAIGRAGVGVNNIDIGAASERGVVVMNTPAGNTISTAEHAFSLMLSLARRIPQAHASVIAGKWERKAFQGTEIYNKRLAILGMGRIGTEFARRAMGFGMRVIAFDPYLSTNRAKTLRVELADSIEAAVADADFITMHMPLSDDTRNILNAERLAKLKKGVRIINCARGGLIDETALAAALESGVVGGAALDVYDEEPPPAGYALFEKDNVVLTPHLGASTREAQEGVGIEIADTISNFLKEGAIVNAVNMPNVDAKTAEEIGPYLCFAEKLGAVVSQLTPGRPDTLRIEYSGKVSGLDTTMITRSAIKGYLVQSCDSAAVNHVNAPSFAEAQGLRITESHLPGPTEFTDLIAVHVKDEEGSPLASSAGTFFGSSPRIVRINDHPVEASPENNLIIMKHSDTPGQVGQVGTILGKHDINIGNMSVSRDVVGDHAMTVLDTDTPPSEDVLAELVNIDGIESARVVRL